MIKKLSPLVIEKIKNVALIISGIVIAILTIRVLYLELVTVQVMKSTIAELEVKKETSEKTVDLQNTAADLAKVDEKKKEQLPERIKKIEAALAPVYEDIEKRKGENNETSECNCSNSPFWDFDARGVFNSAATAADR